MAFNILRKVLLINKPFQYSIMGWFFALCLFLIAIFYCSLWIFFNQLSAEAVSVGLAPDHVFFQFINEQRWVMNKIFMMAGVVSLFAVLLGGLILSNKVAGPIHRLTQFMLHNKIEDFKPISFRKGDYFPELRDAFNKFIGKE